MSDPDDHLWRLLFDGEARGESSLDGWELRLPSSTDPRTARMVSMHELFHGQLNDSSAMGTLLHGLAWVLRSRPDDPSLQALLRGLVGRCRHVHEAWATWASLSLVGEGAPAVELLAGNPRYLAWFDRADALAGSLRGGYLRYHAVAAGLRATMQGIELQVALDRGLDRLRLSDLPAAHAPDALLRQLLARRPLDLWQQAFVQARSERPDLPGWDLIAETERDPSLYQEVMAAELDETSTWLMACFHEAVRQVLPTAVGVTDFNGHQPFVQPLIEAARALLPVGSIRAPLRAAASGSTPESELVGAFKGERLVIREPPLVAVERAPVGEAAPEALVCGEGPHAHLFLWSAAGRRWRLQHRWPAGGPPDDDAPLTALRKVLRAGEERELQVHPCPGPQTLAQAHAALGGELPIIAVVSMAVYGTEAWSAAWVPALRQITLFAVLMDLDPFFHLDSWSRASGPDFAYAVMELPEDHVPNRVFALKPDGLAHLFILPCMPLMVNALLHTLREVVPEPARFRSDPSFLEGANRLAVGVMLGHLLGEEHLFDFSAGRLHRKEA